jgi:hypothetical protein
MTLSSTLGRLHSADKFHQGQLSVEMDSMPRKAQTRVSRSALSSHFEQWSCAINLSAKASVAKTFKGKSQAYVMMILHKYENTPVYIHTGSNRYGINLL